MKTYIGYYRVSTEEQGHSGLGLKSQQNYVRSFAQSNGILLSEFKDIESGTKDSRNGLKAAIRECCNQGATLVAYDITRISRGGFSMMAELEKSGIQFIEALSPNDSEFSKNVKFIVAKNEAENISRNTKKALRVIQDKLDRGETHISKSGRVITRLGSPVPISRDAIEKSAEVRKQMAIQNPDNKKAGAFIVALYNEGGKSFYAITKALNKSGFKTSKGNDFSQVQVKRLYERYSV